MVRKNNITFKELINTIDIGKDVFKENIEQKFEPMLSAAAQDIMKHYKKLGGNWSIDYFVFSRKQRDTLRKILGRNLTFIVLNMTKEFQKQRLLQRHQPGDEEGLNFLLKLYELFEPAEDSEENAYNVSISKEMSPEDGIEKVIEILKE